MALPSATRETLGAGTLAAFLAARQDPDWLIAEREEALARFGELGIPSRRQEQWRFTDLGDLAPADLAPAPTAGPVDPDRMPPPVATDALPVVLVNGVLHPGLSGLDALPDGLRVSPLDGVRPDLAGHPDLAEHPFVQLNRAFFAGGVVIEVAPGARIERPVHLVQLSRGGPGAHYPRTHVALAGGASLTVVEDFAGDGGYRVLPLTEIHLGPAAALDYHRVLADDEQACHLGAVSVLQEHGSSLRGGAACLGGRLTRTDLAVRLAGPGAECDLGGLTLLHERQIGDFHLCVEHAAPQTSGRQRFKGVLGDRARAVFDGTIRVHRDAQGTSASQDNRNLLLSRKAIANSNPRLEILADDVRCSHGSSTGFLDHDALYYLRARGIGGEEARAMLVRAFAAELLAEIPLAPLRERLEADLARRVARPRP